MAKADSKSGQNQLITSPEQELVMIEKLLGVKPDEIQDAIKKLNAESQQLADQNKELDKIAKLLNVKIQDVGKEVLKLIERNPTGLDAKINDQINAIANQLGMSSPEKFQESIQELLESHQLMQTFVSRLLNSNLKLKHDGRGNWRMLIPQDAWKDFVEGVTPLLINDIKEETE